MHFVYQNAQSPPIHSLSMPMIQNNFRSNVLRSPTDREGAAFVEDFRKPEIGESEVSVISDEEVFRL